VSIRTGQGSIIFYQGAVLPDRDVPTQLIDSINELFSNDFTIADRLFFEQIHETTSVSDALKQAAQINTQENFAPVLAKI
jgi:type I restriction enzyme, R subunit